jgi:hypothetical protein
MQKVPALLKVRQTENEKHIEGSGDAGVKVRKRSEICILLQPKKNLEQLYTNVVEHDVSGQAKNTIHTF